MALGLKCLNEFDDVWMIHLLKENNLSPDTPLPIDIRQLSLVIDLDCILLIIVPARSNPYNGISSLSNLSPKHVVMHSVLDL